MLLDRLQRLDVKTVRLGLLVLVVLAALVFAAVQLLGDDDEPASDGAPVVLSEEELIEAAADFAHPAYWIGPLPDVSGYELTELEDGRIYIRYLTGDASAGDSRPDFLTVGTYAQPDAKAALEQADEAGDTKGTSDRDGFTVLKGSSGFNAYVVFDDQPDLQIEVYGPGEGDAMELVESGALKPVG
jgi:hypothetical protein